VPAVVFDMGGKFDKSFNEAAYTGAERFKKETSIGYREFEVTNEAQREQALRTQKAQEYGDLDLAGMWEEWCNGDPTKGGPSVRQWLIDLCRGSGEKPPEPKSPEPKR